jgi:hypothetical protein
MTEDATRLHETVPPDQGLGMSAYYLYFERHSYLGLYRLASIQG